jgi:hypothetical protein
MKKKSVKIITIFAALVITLPVVHADEISAYAAQEARINAAGYRLSLPRNQTVVEKTLVKGIYKVTDNRNQLQYYLTENGEFTGDYKGWRRGPQNVPATLEEQGQLKYEIMKNIDYDRLVKVQYGTGGQRKLLLFSALDCGYCKKMEASLAKNTKRINTTFYVLPSARDLRVNDQGQFTDPAARTIWDAASRITCASDSAAAWKQFWQNKALPPVSATCKTSGSKLALDANTFKEILSSVKVETTGTPAIILEDGRVVTPPVDFDAKTAETIFGESALANVHKAIRDNLLPIIYLKPMDHGSISNVARTSIKN